MAHVLKGVSDDAMTMILVVVGLVILLGIAVAIVVAIGKPAALNSVPLIGDAMCGLLKMLRASC